MFKAVRIEKDHITGIVSVTIQDMTTKQEETYMIDGQLATALMHRWPTDWEIEKIRKSYPKMDTTPKMKKPEVIKHHCAKCAKIHSFIPHNARESIDEYFAGWYFECECKGTIFIKAGKFN